MSKSPRCLYYSDIGSFLSRETESVFGALCDKYHGDALTTTREAWIKEIEILQRELTPWEDTDGRIVFEYDITRLGKRIDVVLLLKGIIFCLEFKVGEASILENDVDQVLDYALDLKNFHKYSQDRVIVPVLIATKYNKKSSLIQPSVYDDRVVNPLITGEIVISDLLKEVLQHFPNESEVDSNWIISPYAPTPTIIEAARTLYESHSVEDITRHEADEVMTDRTISYILDVIKKSIEFSNEREFEDHISIFTKFKRLIEIALLGKVNIEKVYAFSKKIKDDYGDMSFERKIDIYGNDIRVLGASEIPDRISRYNWISLTNLIENKSFESYLEKHEKLESIIELFTEPFYLKGSSITRVFLNVVQALETYHSRFITNDMRTFKTRVKNLTQNKPSADADLIKKRLIANSRKFITLESRLADLLYANGETFFDTGDVGRDDFPSVIARTRHSGSGIRWHYCGSKQTASAYE